MIFSAPSFHFDGSNCSNPSTSIYFKQLVVSSERNESITYIIYTPENYQGTQKLVLGRCVSFSKSYFQVPCQLSGAYKENRQCGLPTHWKTSGSLHKRRINYVPTVTGLSEFQNINETYPICILHILKATGAGFLPSTFSIF